MTEISIIIPVFDEQGSLRELHSKLTRVLGGMNRSYELIFVDDGSRDTSLDILSEIFEADPRSRVLSFRTNYGKSAALSVGFDEARGDIIITIDADLQDDPEEIPRLIEKIDQG